MARGCDTIVIQPALKETQINPTGQNLPVAFSFLSFYWTAD